MTAEYHSIYAVRDGWIDGPRRSERENYLIVLGCTWHLTILLLAW
jgi:hypothetical protein